MGIRERILMIRLLEKVSKHPLYAKSLGIEGGQLRIDSDAKMAADTPAPVVVM